MPKIRSLGAFTNAQSWNAYLWVRGDVSTEGQGPAVLNYRAAILGLYDVFMGLYSRFWLSFCPQQVSIVFLSLPPNVVVYNIYRCSGHNSDICIYCRSIWHDDLFVYNICNLLLTLQQPGASHTAISGH